MSYLMMYRPLWDYGASQVQATVYGGSAPRRKKKKRTDYKGKIAAAMHPVIEMPTAEGAPIIDDDLQDAVIYFIDEL